MPRYIIKLTKKKIDYYLEYSTVVNSPITHGMTFEEFEKYYYQQYGLNSKQEFIARMQRAKETGTSAFLDSLSYLISVNKCGENGKRLSKKEFIKKYTE